MLRSGCVVLCCLLVGTSVAQAATVGNVVGRVSINSGKGFRAVHGTATAQAGDVVMAGPGGRAEIVYANGCRQKVPAGETVTVLEDFACDAAGIDDGAYILGAIAVGGIIAGALILSSDSNNPSSP